MPELTLSYDEKMERMLEQVRREQNLASLDQAAEWLIRRRLRKGTAGLTGRGRTLHPITQQGDRR
ncbi:hypothetical protein SAMN05661010_00048 [Modicisalibacter muralis]|uniref:Uncharacterized protein n=1 Tax=Modicisalibacter muralis TaxID=119000 RepID=A0A1G9ENT6_9GAMM|nr:hypothetical protein [Halomonas muralis]SDK77779.1 hypothetical protein SAMN05661010_00048 [Halomonas muralis]